MLGFLLGLIGLITMPLVALVIGVILTLMYVKDMEVEELYNTFIKKRTLHEKERLTHIIKDEL